MIEAAGKAGHDGKAALEALRASLLAHAGGAALVVEGIVQPLEIAHLPYRNGKTYEDFLGRRGLDRAGKKRWRRLVAEIVPRLQHAFQVDEVVLGGGNVKALKTLPPGCRLGSNAHAFLGGFRVWERRRP